MGSGRDRYQGPPEDDFTTDYGNTEDELPRRRTRRFETGPETTQGQGRQWDTGQSQQGRRTRDFPGEQDVTTRRRVRPASSSSPAHRAPTNYDDEYDEPSRRRRRRRRSAWPALLGGCAIGIFVVVVAAGVVVFLALRSAQTGLPSSGGLPGIGGGGSSVFKDISTVPVQLSSLSNLQVCDKIGNISIGTDSTVTQPQVKTTKIVHAASASDAKQEFSKIAIEVQPPATINNPSACTRAVATPTPGTNNGTPTAGTNNANNALTVNVTLPSDGGLLQSQSDAVDVQVTLPTSFFSTGSTNTSAAPFFLNVQAPLGNITIDGLQGVLLIKGSSGNINLTHATLLTGSDVEMGQGNITFNGSLAPDSDPNASSSYILHSEQGAIDVTLPSTTNVTLDASSNVGAIRGSDFSINVNGNGGPVSYRGALNSATTSAKAVLTIDVSIGNITLHKSS